jgi:hypothetical protein
MILIIMEDGVCQCLLDGDGDILTMDMDILITDGDTHIMDTQVTVGVITHLIMVEDIIHPFMVTLTTINTVKEDQLVQMLTETTEVLQPMLLKIVQEGIKVPAMMSQD